MVPKGRTSEFIPVSLSSPSERTGGWLSFRIREAGTSVSSDFSSWKANVSKFHWEAVKRDTCTVRRNGPTVDHVEDGGVSTAFRSSGVWDVLRDDPPVRDQDHQREQVQTTLSGAEGRWILWRSFCSLSFGDFLKQPLTYEAHK